MADQRREMQSLRGKLKWAWRSFFEERAAVHDLQRTRDGLRQTVADIRAGVQPDITFLTRQFLELYDKVGELCDCPVCWCTLTKEETAVPFCGHLVCKACKLRLTECPTCRKSYWISCVFFIYDFNYLIIIIIIIIYNYSRLGQQDKNNILHL